MRASRERVNAAAAGIRLARTAYLPRVDALAQVNRATRNNVFGLLLPQSVIPSISGPVIGSNNLGSVWGGAVGTLVSWEPFDFGLRGASVAAADAARAQSEAAAERTRFETGVAAADAYLTTVAAGETIRAAQAGVERAETVTRIIGAQVDAQLRPGADRSRAEAEIAAARTQLIQAQQAADVARAGLAQYAGGDPSAITVSAGNLTRLPAEAALPAMNPEANPVWREQNATADQARAQLRILSRSYFPKFYLQGAAYARGSGAEITGTRLGGVNGTRALGAELRPRPHGELPADGPARSARPAGRAECRDSPPEEARSEQIALELRTAWNRAVANLAGARRIAANTPVEVSAARTTVQQATARYQSGLGNITEVADAQRLLAQAEIDDALARLSVWRGLLAIAAASGDIRPFLAEAGR